MINNDWSYLIYGSLGTLVLLLLQWLIGWLLPRHPWQVSENLRNVRQSSADGNYQGDGDIYNLDRSLMEAEFERPGSTLRMYYHQPTAIIGRFVGSLLVAFTVAGWVLGTIHFACLSLAALLFGIGFLFYPYLTWSASRPRYQK